MWGHVSDMFLVFEFYLNRLKNVEAMGVEILAFPLTWHIAYTTACCYRTSRDLMLKFRVEVVSVYFQPFRRNLLLNMRRSFESRKI